MTTTLERVRAAVIKAVPEILSDCVFCGCGRGEPKCVMVGPHMVEARDITLADCFAALGIGVFSCEETLRHEQEIVHTLAVMWNLALPLHLQREEALTFLDKTFNHD